MNLKGSISISRVNCSHGNDYMSLRVRDAASHCQFLEVTLSLENLMRALTAEAEIPCEFTLTENAPLGKIREYKTENLPLLGYRPKDAERVRAFLTEHEVEGWVANQADITNSNRHTTHKDRSRTARVGFTRFIEREENP